MDRIQYCYPEEIYEELIRTIRDEPKICHYLDVPVQSGSDGILKRMGRKTDTAQIRELIRSLRDEIPDICIRTTFNNRLSGLKRIGIMRIRWNLWMRWNLTVWGSLPILRRKIRRRRLWKTR